MDSIIFDVDGTLWDSTEIVARSWSDYLQTEEHMDRTLTAKLLSSMFGQPLPDIARQLFPDVPEAAEVRVFLLDDVLTVRQQGDSYGSVSRLPS